jgi:hypothetical protein
MTRPGKLRQMIKMRSARRHRARPRRYAGHMAGRPGWFMCDHLLGDLEPGPIPELGGDACWPEGCDTDLSSDTAARVRRRIFLIESVKIQTEGAVSA